MRYALFLMALFYLLASPAMAGSHVTEDALDAVFYVRVKLDYTLNGDGVSKAVSTTIGGSSFCVSPEGYLVTCKHVGDPLTILIESVRQNRGPWKSISDVKIQFRAENRQGSVFYTDYAPRVLLRSSPELQSFGISINGLETRSDCDDERRNLRVVSFHKEEDVMMLKVEHSSPLPYLEFAANFDPPECEPLFAVSVRKDSDRNVAAILRPGFLSETEPEQLQINGSTAHKLLMTTIGGDSGSVVIVNKCQIIGMMFANESAEVSGTSYMLFGEALLDLSIECGAVAPPVPEEPCKQKSEEEVFPLSGLDSLF